MVLKIVRWGCWVLWVVAESNWRGAIRHRSTQIRWFSWCQAGRMDRSETVAKHTQNWAKSWGGLPGSSPLRSDGSHGHQVGRLDCINGGQRRWRESQEMTLERQRTYLKTGIVTAWKKVNLLFHRGGWTREMSIMMLMMMKWEPMHHRTVQQTLSTEEFFLRTQYF